MAAPIRLLPPLSLSTIARARSTRPPSRRFATSLQTLPTPAPYLPSYPDRSPSSIATSSAWTLDHPLWAIPSSNKRQNIIAALIFASDEDLVSALVAPSSRLRGPAVEHGEEWAASIDPGLAFLALRSRPTYDLFLQNLRPSLRKVYTRLRKSDNHELLVSDILLRHPDPRLLRDLLDVNHELGPKGQLRPSLQLTIFSRIGPAIAYLPTLPRQAAFRLAKAVLADSTASPGVIAALCEQLKATTDRDNAEEVWTVLSLLLRDSNGTKAGALTLLQQLALDDFLPRSLLSRHEPDHRSAAQLQIYGTALRFALVHKFKIRSQTCTEQLVVVMEQSDISLEGWDSIMESVRTALAPKDMQDAVWAAKTIARISQQPDWPPVPSATIERALEGMPLKDRAGWYSHLPAASYEAPSAAFLLWMANARPNRKLWTKIIADLTSLAPEETAHVQADVLRILLDNAFLHEANLLFDHWGSTQLSFEDVQMVIPATIAARKRKFGTRILKDWASQRPNLGSEHRAKLAGMFLQLNDQLAAREQLLHVDQAAPGVADLLRNISQSNLPLQSRDMLVRMGVASSVV